MPAPALTVRLGRGDEDFGFLAVIRRDESLSEVDRVMLQAMGATVGAGLRSVRTIREVRKLADRDPVTGLQNHRSVHQRLANEIERANRERIFLDPEEGDRLAHRLGAIIADEFVRLVGGIVHVATSAFALSARCLAPYALAGGAICRPIQSW